MQKYTVTTVSQRRLVAVRLRNAWQVGFWYQLWLDVMQIQQSQ